MPNLSHCLITKPSKLKEDGMGFADGQEYTVTDSIIDLSACSLDEIDEAVGVTWGSSARFERCLIRGAGKLILCGCGDKEKVPLEEGKRVIFIDCVFEEGGRRFPEVQDGMRAILCGCLIRNWASSERFDTRSFGAWAHKNGRVDAINCIFWQDRFWRPVSQFFTDLWNHFWQAWNDEKFWGWLRPSTYIPGVCKGMVATDGGQAYAWQCWKNKWWILLPWNHTTAFMSDDEAHVRIARLEKMVYDLRVELDYFD